MKSFFFLNLFLLIFNVADCRAEDWDKNAEEALTNTKNMMVDKKLFDQAAAENSKAKDAAANLDKITTDPKQQQQIRELSASVFSDVAKQNKGDDAKINATLSQGLADPQTFIKSLSPEQQDQLRKLASEIDNSKGK